jgi:hypothetical protein
MPLCADLAMWENLADHQRSLSLSGFGRKMYTDYEIVTRVSSSAVLSESHEPSAESKFPHFTDQHTSISSSILVCASTIF